MIMLLFSPGITQIVIGQESKADHNKWDDLLNKYVDDKGMVDYKNLIGDTPKLETYLAQLSMFMPDESWEDHEKLAYWINVYNAFTVSLVLENYPLKSMMDLKKAWDQKFIKLGNKNYSLNQIEHDIIRKEFDEPRIHFALVCAAVSCPVLLNEAYSASDLDNQLQKQSIRFLNDEKRNQIKESAASISQIFSWFNDDFTKKGSLIDFINQYSQIKLDAEASIKFMEYDWSLNEQK